MCAPPSWGAERRIPPTRSASWRSGRCRRAVCCAGCPRPASSVSAVMPRSRRCSRRSLWVCRRRSTSKMPCSAAPIGSSRRACGGSRPASRRPLVCARPTAPAPSGPATRYGRRCSPSARTKYKAPQRGGPIELLILGGSQGARIMSEAVPPALAALPTRLREMLRVSHQARPEDLPAAEAIYRKNRIQAELQSFFTDVPERLARAHLAICRAGASTIAELACDRPARCADPVPVRHRQSPDRERPSLCRGRSRMGRSAAGVAPGHLRSLSRKSAWATRRH